MPLTLPILEQIMAQIAAKLATVTIANNYQTDVASVYRPATKQGIGRTPPASFVVQLLLADASRNEEENVSAVPPRVTWDQLITVDCVYSPSDTATTPLDQVLLIFGSDITIAMFADPHWTKLAETTEIVGITVFENEFDGSVYLRLVFMIRYRVQENDPYNQ